MTEGDLYIVSASGKEIALPNDSEKFRANDIGALLRDKGFNAADLIDLRITTKKPIKGAKKPPPKAGADPVLPVPQPQSKYDILPPRSPEVLIKATDADLFLLIGGVYRRIGDPYFTPDHFSPPLPPGLQLGYKRYWQNLDSEHLKAPMTFTRQVTTKVGMTTSHSQTLSGELGVSVDGLSAKLSETFSSSITTTQETDVTTTYNFSVSTGVRIWTCWSLVEVFVLLDGKGNETTYNGSWSIGAPGGVTLIQPASFPANRFVNRTTTMYPDGVDFT